MIKRKFKSNENADEPRLSIPEIPSKQDIVIKVVPPIPSKSELVERPQVI